MVNRRHSAHEYCYLHKMPVVGRLSSALIFGVALFYGVAECTTFTTSRSTIYCSDFDCFPYNLRISKLEFFKKRFAGITLCNSGFNMVQQIITDAETILNQKCPVPNANYSYSKPIIENACGNQWKILSVRVTYDCLPATSASQTGYTATAVTITGVTSPLLTNIAAAELSNYTQMYSPTISTEDYQDIASGNNFLTELEDIGLTTRSAANRSLDDKLFSSLNTAVPRGGTIAIAVCTSAGCLAIVITAVYSWRRKLWKKCLPQSRAQDQEALSPQHFATDTSMTESADCSYANCQSLQPERSNIVLKVATSHAYASSQVEKCADKSAERNFEHVYYNEKVLRTDSNYDSHAQVYGGVNCSAACDVPDEKAEEKHDNGYCSQSRDSTYFVLEQVSFEPSTANSFQAISPSETAKRSETEHQDAAEHNTFNFTHGNNHISFQADDHLNAENDLYVAYTDSADE